MATVTDAWFTADEAVRRRQRHTARGISGGLRSRSASASSFRSSPDWSLSAEYS